MRYLLLVLVLCGCKVDNGGHVPPTWDEPMPTSLPTTIPEQPVTQLPQAGDYPGGAVDYAPEARRESKPRIGIVTAPWCAPCKVAAAQIRKAGRLELYEVEFDENKEPRFAVLPSFIWKVNGKLHWQEGFDGGEPALVRNYRATVRE